MGTTLLDHRYAVSSMLSATASSRRFAGSHVGLDAPVRIVELRPSNQPDAARAGDAARCASLAARAAAVRHPILPRVRDCFYVQGVCYVVEDAVEGERLATRLAGGAPTDLRTALRTALRDGLQLCDAVARIAVDVPELLACLLISGSTLVYDVAGAPRLTTLDYSRWLGSEVTLDPGAPDLRAPELSAGLPLAPDERAHVYSIAALLTALLTGSTELTAASAGADLPAVVRAALEPALCADPRRRTPDADTLGRALARAARLALPTLASAHSADAVGRPTSHVEHAGDHLARRATAAAARPPTLRGRAAETAGLVWRIAAHAARLARAHARVAVEAVRHRTGRAINGTQRA